MPPSQSPLPVDPLPYPPEEMRKLVGPTELAHFDNPTRRLLLENVPVDAYESVLDFGCGCGRIARQLIQQDPPPRRYLGLDVHRGMIQWCQRHLAPHAPGFRFEHHDAFQLAFNSGGQRTPVAFPAPAAAFSLVIAWSVFTHLLEPQVDHYLREVARVLRRDGYFFSTWFLFDKSEYPMMQAFQNALYINDVDPTNAVILDRRWLLALASARGLKVVAASPPALRGYQWVLVWTHADHPAAAVELPEDRAPKGSLPPPLMPEGAEEIGR
jgi:SAM-dependent methyltransferase